MYNGSVYEQPFLNNKKQLKLGVINVYEDCEYRFLGVIYCI